MAAFGINTLVAQGHLFQNPTVITGCRKSKGMLKEMK
jgi:hypothetical protein